MRRRDVLAALAAGPFVHGQKPGRDPADRPNILFVIADDWSWPHAGIYGDTAARTPAFDRVANEGVLFSNAFCAAPTCTASRGAILTGQAPHRLETGVNLQSTLHAKFATFPDLLESTGYFVGYAGKGWGPGVLRTSGRTRNPAGPRFRAFPDFLRAAPAGKPFCFWLGPPDPHRPYQRWSGVMAGFPAEKVTVPPYLPDTPEVRGDLADYYDATSRFDRALAAAMKELADRGLGENTLVVVTSDNGWPFPRAKANLYDAGTHMPLAVRWPAFTRGARVVEDLVSSVDLAPAFLEAARVPVPAAMTGRSLLDLVSGTPSFKRDRVFIERERHTISRRGGFGYPMRAVRTVEFLYIVNHHSERWPAGDPDLFPGVSPWSPFADADDGPSKDTIMRQRRGRYFVLGFGKRPKEELYDLRRDPHQLKNVAGHAGFRRTQDSLRLSLQKWMADTGDPRIAGQEAWDQQPYFGPILGQPEFEGQISPDQ